MSNHDGDNMSSPAEGDLRSSAGESNFRKPLGSIRESVVELNGGSHDEDAPPVPPIAWPFQVHRRGTGSSALTSSISTGQWLRRSWQKRKSFLQSTADSSSLISRSIIPDYVVNYIRGETPESLAKKREVTRKGTWRGVDITPKRQSYMSRAVDYDTIKLDGMTIQDPTWRRGKSPKGWRGGVASNAVLALLILLVLAVYFIVEVVRAGEIAGNSIIFSGACETTKNINIGVHVLINVFTVGILAGANYAFHILSSPTKAEVAAAHNMKRWVDIGVPSFRNLLYIDKLRSSLALFILLLAIATQVIYNMVIFTTQTAIAYDVVFVSNNFSHGATIGTITASDNAGGLTRSQLQDLQTVAVKNELVDLDPETCQEKFGGSFETTYDAVLLVMGESGPNGSSVIQTEASGTSLKTYKSDPSSSKMALKGSSIESCLARAGAAQTCNVVLNRSILGMVGILNIATVISVAIVLLIPFQPLVTLGDAIHSFMQQPDPTTAGSCLLTKSDAKKGNWNLNEPRRFNSSRCFWFLAPSGIRWGFSGFSWLLLTIPTATGLGLILGIDSTEISTPFGKATPYTTLPLSTLFDSSTKISAVTAIPHFFLAVLYLATNALLTTFFLSHEFSLFAVRPSPLRVSADPLGIQTTSLYLTLPRPVSWLILSLFAVMGMVVSEAIFPAIIDVTTSTSTMATSQILGLSLSTSALPTLLGLLVLLAIGVLALGLRTSPNAAVTTAEDGELRSALGNPLVMRGGSCSAVVSARCHPLGPGDKGDEPWNESIGWGLLGSAHPAMLDVGHCGFGMRDVCQVDTARRYM